MKPKKKRPVLLRIGKWVALVFNILLVLLLILAYFATYVNTEKTTFFAFIGLAFPYLVVSNFIFALIWAIKRKWIFFIISFLPIIGGWGMVSRYFQLLPINRNVPDGSFKVMTYNVRNFDVYNFITNQMGFKNRDKIMKTISDEAPDIICFQEFYYDAHHTFRTYDTLLTMLPPMNLHIRYTAVNRKIAYFGLATFSRFPIVHRDSLRFPVSKDNSCIITDVLIGKDTVRIFNMHLASIGFGKEDYGITDLFNEVTNRDEENIKRNIANIFVRLKQAFIRRAAEARMVAAYIAASPHPVIVCGDFNDTPISYAYNQISRNLKDAFKESGFGFSQTYAGPFPSFRIDHILYSPYFKSYSYQVLKKEGSDHYPVITYLKARE